MPLFCSIIATNKTKFFVNKFKNKSKKLFKKLNQKLQVKALVLTILGCEYKFIKCIKGVTTSFTFNYLPAKTLHFSNRGWPRKGLEKSKHSNLRQPKHWYLQEEI